MQANQISWWELLRRADQRYWRKQINKLYTEIDLWCTFRRQTYKEATQDGVKAGSLEPRWNPYHVKHLSKFGFREDFNIIIPVAGRRQKAWYLVGGLRLILSGSIKRISIFYKMGPWKSFYSSHSIPFKK